MEDKPGHGRRLSKQQETPFTEQKDEKPPVFSRQPGASVHGEHELQKKLKLWLLISAFLAIGLNIILYFWAFGTTSDAFRLLLSSIIESLVTVLLIYIFRQVLFDSIDKLLSQKDEELEQTRKVFEAQLEILDKKQNTLDTRLTLIEKQLKKHEQELKASEKRLKQGIQDAQKDTTEAISVLIRTAYATQEKRIRQIEDHMSLTH